MQQAEDSTLYLSKDKQYLTDTQGVVVGHRVQGEGATYYASISIESEAYKKKCTALEAQRVCTVWNENNSCLVWDEVDVCTQWQYQPYGFTNIS